MTLADMNSVIQALVWTTLAGLLYAVWLRSQSTSGSFKFEMSQYWQPILQVLRWMWMLLAVGLIISLLVFAWPRVSSAQVAAPACTHTIPLASSTGSCDSSQPAP